MRKSKQERYLIWRAWYDRVREKRLAQQKTYYEVNKEQRLAYAKSYVNANRNKINIKASARAKRVRKATPHWANSELIEMFYTSAKHLNSLGIGEFHVDHIVPLHGENVCGLHVHWNLQVIRKEFNLEKSNKFENMQQA